MNEQTNGPGPDNVGGHLAVRLVESLVMLNTNLESDREMREDIREILTDIREELRIWGRAMEILGDNAEDRKVTFRDLLTSWSMANAEAGEDDDDQEEGEGGEPLLDPSPTDGGRVRR